LAGYNRQNPDDYERDARTKMLATKEDILLIDRSGHGKAAYEAGTRTRCRQQDLGLASNSYKNNLLDRKWNDLTELVCRGNG
jgi:hypothetical protein